MVRVCDRLLGTVLSSSAKFLWYSLVQVHALDPYCVVQSPLTTWCREACRMQIGKKYRYRYRGTCACGTVSPLWPLGADLQNAECSVVHTSQCGTHVYNVWYTPLSVVHIHTSQCLSSASPSSSSSCSSSLGALMWHCMPCVVPFTITQHSEISSGMLSIQNFHLLLLWKHSWLATLCLSIPLICD